MMKKPTFFHTSMMTIDSMATFLSVSQGTGGSPISLM